MQLSLELYVPRHDDLQGFMEEWQGVLNHPLINTISVTRGTGPDYCSAKHLRFLGLLKQTNPKLNIISHVTLSHFEPATLQELRDANIGSILALTGDDSASSLASSLHLQDSTEFLAFLAAHDEPFNLYASGYPNGYMPKDGETYQGLAHARGVAKLKGDASSNLTLVTQWSYSLKAQLDFIEQIQIPTLIGYFPFKSYEHAERVAKRCGLYITQLEKDAQLVIRNLQDEDAYSWEARFEFDLQRAVNFRDASDKLRCLAGFHLFTMNDLEVANKAIAIAQSVLSPIPLKEVANAS